MKKYFTDLCVQLGHINLVGLLGLLIVNDQTHRSPTVQFPPYLLQNENSFIAEWYGFLKTVDPTTAKSLKQVEKSKKFNLFIGKHLRFIGGTDMIPSLFINLTIVNPEEYVWN